MKKIIYLFSKIVVFVFLLNIFAWCVFHVNGNGQKLGVLTKPLRDFSRFPELFFQVAQELIKPERLVYVEENFEPVNTLEYDVFGLNASFENSGWLFKLRNLRNDSVLKTWFLDKHDYVSTGREFSHAEPRLPILLEDGSIIAHNDESYNLYRLDKNSNLLWHNTDYQYHHSINLDHQGNIWVCSRDTIKFHANNIVYWDNYITNVDTKTGQLIMQKSLTEIFVENDLGYMLHAHSNIPERFGNDPLHLNDIEPVLKDGKYWKKGDLFLSLRNRSLIVLYRPSTNTILHLMQGPFSNQHDVCIQNDSTISFFNNNTTGLDRLKKPHKGEPALSHLLPDTTLNIASQVLTYCFSDSSYTKVYEDQFIANKAYTWSQGLHYILSNGDLFVEIQNFGKVFMFREGETVYRQYYNESNNGKIEPPHWVRLYENIDFLVENALTIPQ